MCQWIQVKRFYRQQTPEMFVIPQSEAVKWAVSCGTLLSSAHHCCQSGWGHRLVKAFTWNTEKISFMNIKYWAVETFHEQIFKDSITVCPAVADQNSRHFVKSLDESKVVRNLCGILRYLLWLCLAAPNKPIAAEFNCVTHPLLKWWYSHGDLEHL